MVCDAQPDEEGDSVPVTEPLVLPLPLREPLVEPLSVPVTLLLPQALADTDRLALCEGETDCDVQPEPVLDFVPEGEALAQLLGLWLPLAVPEKEALPDAEPHDEADTDTLELGVSVPD